MASRKQNKKWKVYRELTEKEKDDILHWITNLNRPIKDATEHFNLSLNTINKIYEKLGISCQPLAINSGNTWPKYGPKKINTTITISILKPIEPGLENEIFLKKLENTIYSELNILN